MIRNLVKNIFQPYIYNIVIPKKNMQCSRFYTQAKKSIDMFLETF